MARIRRQAEFVETYERIFNPSFVVRGTTNPEINYIPIVTRTFPYGNRNVTITGVTRSSATSINSFVVSEQQFNNILVGDIISSPTNGVTLDTLPSVTYSNTAYFAGLPFVIYEADSVEAVRDNVRIGDGLVIRDSLDARLNPTVDYIVDNIDYAHRKIYYASVVDGNERQSNTLLSASGIGSVLVQPKVRVTAKNPVTRVITINGEFIYPATHTLTTQFNLTVVRSLVELPVTVFRISALDLNERDLSIEISDINPTNLTTAQMNSSNQGIFDTSKPLGGWNLENFVYLNISTRRYNVDAQLNSVGYPVTL